MKLPLAEKYRGRLEELDALRAQLAGAGKTGESGAAAVVAGRLLEVAGDLVRRSGALGAQAAQVRDVLKGLSSADVKAWADAVDLDELSRRLSRAADQAVEAAIPDSVDAGEAVARFVMQDLFARDRLESALIALDEAGKAGVSGAAAAAAQLRTRLASVDGKARRGVRALTAVNAERRQEAQLLDPAHRSVAWWLLERSGMEDDTLVRSLGGEAVGTLGAAEQRVSDDVKSPRRRRWSEEELLRMDMGLASDTEVAALRTEAASDPELKLVLAALEEGERAIEELTAAPRGTAPSNVVSMPADRPRPRPDRVEERADFRVLIFKARTVQVVVQATNSDRLAAAAVFLPDAPERPLPSESTEQGLSFDLGPSERLAAKRARVTVKLQSGETDSVDLSL